MVAVRVHEQGDRPDGWRVRTYDRWVAAQRVPVVGGLAIADLNAVEVGPWEQKGAAGAIVRLLGAEDMTGSYILELEPAGSAAPQRHLYDELVHVLSGRGFTTVWNDLGATTTFEWSAGALFAMPLNARYQHHNASSTDRARFVAVNNATIYMNLIHNLDFIFGCEYDFTDRFDHARSFDGTGTQHGHRIWETNFVADVNTLHLEHWAARGKSRNTMIELTNSSIGAHVSEFDVGTYKKAHRHGAGTHIVMLSGEGYSLMWREGEQVERVDWTPGAFIAPPDRWFHQHFNTGAEPARYLALRYNSRKWGLYKQYGVDKSVKQGGDQIEYGDQEPWIHKTFVEECARRGVTVDMPQIPSA